MPPRALLTAFSRSHDRSKSSPDHAAIQKGVHGAGIPAVVMTFSPLVVCSTGRMVGGFWQEKPETAGGLV
ncbi:hypothetical protein F5X99DRAFT_368149 [Biscogniauxia marginata]|nr:hypothetical protein F5X99DRAFT_368149 [Biscogniauxia marginata]